MHSSRNILVTYESDVSDAESPIEKVTHTTQDSLNDGSELRSMDISPISDDSIIPSADTSPKEEIDDPPKKKIRMSDRGMRGLVNYAVDEDDSNDELYDEENVAEFSNASDEKESSKSKERASDTQPLPEVDNEECFNVESRDSDDENDNGDRLHQHQTEVDLKQHSGQSSSTVKAIVITERPQGTELEYKLSLAIFKNPGEIKLPSLPQKKAAPEIEMKIQELRSKSSTSRDSSFTIMSNKEFRNPSIYEKLLEHMKINERGTNYPPELYDPYRFGEESYYERLAKEQDAAERKRQEQDSKETSGSANKSSSSKGVPSSVKSADINKFRKTKWDSGQKPSLSKSFSSGSVVIETKTMFPVHK